jgi:hypothetical protein
MRYLIGIGTPRGLQGRLAAALAALIALWTLIEDRWASGARRGNDPLRPFTPHQRYELLPAVPRKCLGHGPAASSWFAAHRHRHVEFEKIETLPETMFVNKLEGPYHGQSKVAQHLTQPRRSMAILGVGSTGGITKDRIHDAPAFGLVRYR